MEENKKEVLIVAKVDNQDAINSTEQLKNKFKALTDQALKFDEIDYDNSSIGDLRDHLQQANTVLKQLKSSGLASEQQLADMAKTVGKLKDNIAGMKINNAFAGAEASVKGVVGSAMLLEGGMKSLGIESESVAKSIERMMALQNVADGVENLSEYATGMKALMGATAGASSATTVLRVGMMSLGIGAVISLIVYLTNNWESLSKTLKSFIPELDGVTKYFKNIQPIMEGVGKALIMFVIRPIQGVIGAIKLLLDGEFKQAGLKLIDALNPVKRVKDVVNDFKSGYAQGIVNANKKKNEQVKKDNIKANNEAINEQKRLAEEQKKLIEEVSKYIVDAEKYISDSKKSARQIELDDLDTFYSEQIAKAEKAGKETNSLLEVQRLKRAEINKKFDEEEAKKAEDAKVKAQDEKVKSLENNVSSTQMEGETDVLKAQTGTDTSTSEGLEKVNNAKLESLRKTFEAEQLLHAENKQKLEQLEAQYANNVYQINKELSDKKAEEKAKEVEDEKAKNELKLQSSISIADSIASIAGETSAIGKASAIASATMNTYQSATKALAEVPFPFNYAVMASNIAMGLMQVKKILSTKTVGDKKVGASITAPTINMTQLQPRATQDVRVVGNQTKPQEQQFTKVYITNKDLENQNSKNNLDKSISQY